MIDLPPFDSSSEARARMTLIQCKALAQKLETDKLTNELSQLAHLRSFSKSSSCRVEEVKKWVANGWNTEVLVKANKRLLDEDALKQSLQWIFPQAYYSAFSLCLAYFIVGGYTQRTHAGVIKEFGDLISRDKYPKTISFYCDGGLNKVSFKNLQFRQLTHTLEYDRRDEDCVDAQIKQFLNSTRQNDLKEKLPKLGLKTKKGKKKVKFDQKDYDQASKKLGNTSILSLLYRKRIKANYQDIETLISDYLDAESAYEAIVAMLEGINLIHESFIFKALKKKEFEDILNSVKKRHRNDFEQRIERIKEMI